MMRARTDSQPITEAEARRRLGEAYRLLLDLAARRRAQNAEQSTDASEPSTDNDPDCAA